MANTTDMELAVRTRGVTKEFFGQPVLEGVDFDLRWGEIHALLGENGAGKSTLCSILAGLYHPTRGEMTLAGAPYSPHSPHEALQAGVGMVYQHFRLVEQMTVAENILLGNPDVPARITAGGLADRARDAMDSHGLWIEPTASVSDLAVGEKQQTEIIRLLNRGVEVLILDEPTAVLTPGESDALFVALRSLADQGKAVILVTHKLREVQQSADTVTVLRAGRKVSHQLVADTTPNDLARLMIGDDIALGSKSVDERHAAGDKLLELRSISAVSDETTRPELDGIDLTVRRGQIVGVAGVSGNGQRELAEVITGLRSMTSGSIRLAGEDIASRSTADRIKMGMGFVPEDRLTRGLVLGLELDDNVLLRSQRDPRFSIGPFLRLSAVREWARRLIDRFDIRGVRKGLPIGVLSGGNLQRLILARELARQPTLLVASEPTRGLDVGAAEAVRSMLTTERGRGVGILLVSGDLEEVLELADEVVVMYEGRIVASRPASDVDVDQVGRWMAGLT
ncbi:MAG: ABC transporter ATP-binding protein [Acidimicrobiaceae bacterium]|nr:ABC transporter ATP-binding protein [Acidimicrobiaceae bacterium]